MAPRQTLNSGGAGTFGSRLPSPPPPARRPRAAATTKGKVTGKGQGKAKTGTEQPARSQSPVVASGAINKSSRLRRTRARVSSSPEEISRAISAADQASPAHSEDAATSTPASPSPGSVSSKDDIQSPADPMGSFMAALTGMNDPWNAMRDQLIAVKAAATLVQAQAQGTATTTTDTTTTSSTTTTGSDPDLIKLRSRVRAWRLMTEALFSNPDGGSSKLTKKKLLERVFQLQSLTDGMWRVEEEEDWFGKERSEGHIEDVEQLAAPVSQGGLKVVSV